MAFQNLDAGSLDIFSPLLGSAVNIPKGFWKPGTAAIYNGYFGTSALLNYGQGTLNVGMSPDSPFAYTGAPGNVNLHNISLTTYIGDHRVVGRSSVTGIQFRTSTVSNEIYGGTNLIAGKSVDIVGKNTVIAGANVTIGAPNLTIGGRNWYASTALWDSKKSFDIPHPSKENRRLRYICIEGPSADIFVIGRSNENIIELPDYWKDLVDEKSITVNLTAIGSSATPRVMNVVNNTIVVFSKEEGILDYYYTIYGERKDTTKNIPEYEGKTSDDYPGDNREYVINGGKN